MKTKLAGNQDALTGLIFIALGAIGLLIALRYEFGSTTEMGPGYFPRVLSGLLVGLGLLILVRDLRNGVSVDGAWAWVPLALVTAAILLFGGAIERFGLVPAVALLIVVSAYAGHEFKLTEVAVLTIVMALLTAGIFVWGLSLPYALFAWNF